MIRFCFVLFIFIQIPQLVRASVHASAREQKAHHHTIHDDGQRWNSRTAERPVGRVLTEDTATESGRRRRKETHSEQDRRIAQERLADEDTRASAHLHALQITLYLCLYYFLPKREIGVQFLLKYCFSLSSKKLFLFCNVMLRFQEFSILCY